MLLRSYETFHELPCFIEENKDLKYFLNLLQEISKDSISLALGIMTHVLAVGTVKKAARMSNQRILGLGVSEISMKGKLERMATERLSNGCLTGQKNFITNGLSAEAVWIVARNGDSFPVFELSFDLLTKKEVFYPDITKELDHLRIEFNNIKPVALVFGDYKQIGIEIIGLEFLAIFAIVLNEASTNQKKEFWSVIKNYKNGNAYRLKNKLQPLVPILPESQLNMFLQR